MERWKVVHSCDSWVLNINLKDGMMTFENRLATGKRSYRRPHFLHGHLGHAASDHESSPFISSFSVLIIAPNPILQAFSLILIF